METFTVDVYEYVEDYYPEGKSRFEARIEDAKSVFGGYTTTLPVSAVGETAEEAREEVTRYYVEQLEKRRNYERQRELTRTKKKIGSYEVSFQ